MNQEPDMFRIYLYAKGPYEAKYQFLINKQQSTGLKRFNDSKAFIEYSNDMNDIFKSIEEYNPNKKRKILIFFDDMISDILTDKKLNPIVTELFIRGRKLKISLVFITQSCFSVPKNGGVLSAHYFIMKILNKRELKQLEFNHSLDIDFKDLMNLYRKCTEKPYSFLVTDYALRSDIFLRFRENLSERI